jgi:hypothetical protein
MSYNPNQPRDPRGVSTGGRWTKDGSRAAVSARVGAGLSSAKNIDNLMTQLKKGGFSVSMDGKSPKSGYMTAFTDKTEVKIDPEQVTRKDILSFIMNNARVRSGWCYADGPGCQTGSHL